MQPKKNASSDAMTMQTTQFVPIKGTDASGNTVWYTGRAGAGWISPNRKDAFMGYSADGAARYASRFNETTPIHGIRFEAEVSKPDVEDSLTFELSELHRAMHVDLIAHARCMRQDGAAHAQILMQAARARIYFKINRELECIK